MKIHEGANFNYSFVSILFDLNLKFTFESSILEVPLKAILGQINFEVNCQL